MKEIFTETLDNIIQLFMSFVVQNSSLSSVLIRNRKKMQTKKIKWLLNVKECDSLQDV